jgi:hypothetical protein
LGFVDFALELKDGVLAELLLVEFAVGFGPCKFPGVVFGFEVFVALGPAESEHLAVIAHEDHTVTGIDWPRTEVALLYSHGSTINII